MPLVVGVAFRVTVLRSKLFTYLLTWRGLPPPTPRRQPSRPDGRAGAWSVVGASFIYLSIYLSIYLF